LVGDREREHYDLVFYPTDDPGGDDLHGVGVVLIYEPK
jgi:hypothetical protein